MQNDKQALDYSAMKHDKQAAPKLYSLKFVSNAISLGILPIKLLLLRSNQSVNEK
jgi:hypothetical protein